MLLTCTCTVCMIHVWHWKCTCKHLWNDVLFIHDQCNSTWPGVLAGSSGNYPFLNKHPLVVHLICTPYTCVSTQVCECCVLVWIIKDTHICGNVGVNTLCSKQSMKHYTFITQPQHLVSAPVTCDALFSPIVLSLFIATCRYSCAFWLDYTWLFAVCIYACTMCVHVHVYCPWTHPG